MVVSHGGDVYRNKITYDFSVNINPLGIPEECRHAAIDGMALAEQYPDVEGEKLVEAIAVEKQIPGEYILLGNGAAELIYAFCQAQRPKRAVTISPTFMEYEAAVQAVGGEMEYVGAEEMPGHITQETDVVFLCNPNNPTGEFFHEDYREALFRRCRMTDTWLFVDECFLPFLRQDASDSMLRVFRENKGGERLIVLRAFTKIYAMPGLRLGYAVVGDLEQRERMRRQLQPWNTSIPAQLAGIRALKLTGYLERTWEVIQTERAYLTTELSALAKDGLLRVYDTEANFFLLYSEYDLYKGLLEQNIMIRDCSNFRGLKKGYYRIAIRSHRENEALIDALKRVSRDLK